jgi:hypothetical protein
MSATGAGNDFTRCFVAANRVDGDGQSQSTSIAWRPLYQPQLGQTTCGSFAWRHCGQLLCAGVASVHADARRLRLLDFEVFFFGTAIVSS